MTPINSSRRESPPVHLRLLGSAAGGGFPQWNCGCVNCNAARAGSLRHRPRTQDSLAISIDRSNWFLMNASPDIHRQIENFHGLHPRSSRHSPIAGIFLSNGDLDHCLGLLSLRESQPLTVYSTANVRRALVERNVLLRTLNRFSTQLTWRILELNSTAEVCDGLEVTTRAVPGKLPVHLDGLDTPHAEDNVGFWIRDRATEYTAAYVPNVARLEPSLLDRLAAAECIFFDGTFWSDDELIQRGLSRQRAHDMAHLTVSGPLGSLARLQHLSARRKIYTHINNTNPLLDESSPEHRSATRAGWEIGTDGMEITL